MPSVRQELASKIYQKIRDGSLLTGDKLPTEREIAALLAVSRTAAREALIVLETLGLIEIRGKEGMYLRKLSEGEFSRSLDVYSAWPAEMLPQTFQVRILLESEAAGLAARHRTDEDIQRMDYCLQRLTRIYENRPSDWNHQGATLNDLFHRLVIEAAHNEVLLRIHEGLAGTIARAQAAFGVGGMITPLEQWQERIIDGHRKIRDAVERQDEHLARDIMREHLVITFNKLNAFYRDRVEGALPGLKGRTAPYANARADERSAERA